LLKFTVSTVATAKPKQLKCKTPAEKERKLSEEIGKF